MRHHRLTILAVLLAAIAAFAVSHNFSGTVNTPAVPTWVDGSSNEITPYMTLGPSNTLYLDTGTGYVWTIQDILTNPSAVGQSLSALFYTSVNCTGTAYLYLPSFTLPSIVQTAPSTSTYYVGGAPAAVTIHSEFLSGSCYSTLQTVDFYTAVGPLTPPTLTSAPWHLELR